eukprot:213208_1
MKCNFALNLLTAAVGEAMVPRSMETARKINCIRTYTRELLSIRDNEGRKNRRGVKRIMNAVKSYCVAMDHQLELGSGNLDIRMRFYNGGIGGVGTGDRRCTGIDTNRSGGGGDDNRGRAKSTNRGGRGGRVNRDSRTTGGDSDGDDDRQDVGGDDNRRGRDDRVDRDRRDRIHRDRGRDRVDRDRRDRDRRDIRGKDNYRSDRSRSRDRHRGRYRRS